MRPFSGLKRQKLYTENHPAKFTLAAQITTGFVQCKTGEKAGTRNTAIDFMHNDVKQCFRGSNVHCGSYSHERIQFPEAPGNLNSSNVDICNDVARSSSGSSGDLFELWIWLYVPYFYYFLLLLARLVPILDLSVTTTTILPFAACYVIMHKVYCFLNGKMASKNNSSKLTFEESIRNALRVVKQQ